MPFDYFGTATNLSISIAVVIYGAAAWLRQDPSGAGASPPFKRQAYIYWWAAWLVWVVAWALILIVGAAHKTESIHWKILILILDNLNSIFMIIVYIAITRGDAFGPRQIRLALGWILGTLGACTAPLYLLSSLFGLTFAYEVHSTWGLCLSVVSPILVGWAIHLRFRTVSVLAVGFVYGFIQPIVYAAELQAASPAIAHVVNGLRPAIAMTLGGLKVTFAIVFTQVLALGVAEGASLVEDKAVEKFKIFKGSSNRLIGHTLMLLIIYTILLIVMFMYYAASLTEFAVALGIVGGLISLFDVFWRLFDEANRRFVIPIKGSEG